MIQEVLVKAKPNQLAGIGIPGDLYFECNVFKSAEEFEIRFLEYHGLDRNGNDQHNCT